MKESDADVPKYLFDFVEAQIRLKKKYKISWNMWKKYVDPIIKYAILAERDRIKKYGF